MHATLMVMAAGLSARYGGNKLFDGMGPHGEMLLEYAVYDALEAGFDRVVFVIKEEIAAAFQSRIGDRIAKKAEVCYVCQKNDAVPTGLIPPSNRMKPYGTVHAVWCAKEHIHEPFAVINSDDYYGRGAFAAMRKALSALKPSQEAAVMAYSLQNTLSKNGHVTRGICQIHADGTLKEIHETYWVIPRSDGTVFDVQTNQSLDPNAPVSMNFWGFTPWIFSQAEMHLRRFLQELQADDVKTDYPLPALIDALIQEKSLKVNVLKTEEIWFGATYQLDKANVSEKLQTLQRKGSYPDVLFP